MVLAAATAGVLVAFGLRLGHPMRVLGYAIPFRAAGPTAPDAWTGIAAIFAHVAISVIWSTLFLLLVIRLRISTRMLPVAAAIAAAVLFVVLHRLLPPSARPGYDALLTGAQLLVLHITIAAGLVFGIRLALLQRR